MEPDWARIYKPTSTVVTCEPSTVEVDNSGFTANTYSPDTPGKCSCGTGIDTSEPGDYEVTLTGGFCTDMSYENIHAVHFADLDGMSMFFGVSSPLTEC